MRGEPLSGSGLQLVTHPRPPAGFSAGTGEIFRSSSRKPPISNCLHVREAAQCLPPASSGSTNAATINVHYSEPGGPARSTVA